MAGNGPIHKLILRWLLLRQQGLTIAPAELCRDCPEHQQDVERSLQAMLALSGLTVDHAGDGQNGAGGKRSAAATGTAFPPAVSESPVSGLLLRWQEERDRGADLSVEELCRDCPEHREEVAVRLRALRDFHALLGAVDLVGGSSGPLRPVVPGYEILEPLGEGGMGRVYKARQLRLDRIVALKMIRDGGRAVADSLGRFRTEAEAIARLQHPNIVAVYEVGEHDNRPFLAMEYCPGGGLDRKLAGGSLAPHEAAALVETLARAVEAAHRAHVIHRDLKPANVLLAADGSPRISDFGLARKLDEAGQTQTGEVMGTPSYMAPEQARGERTVGPAVDVYALGAILYELLTGRPPLRGATLFDTIHQVLNEEPVPPRRLNPQVPRDLEAICLTCLEKEPGRRYATAADLAEELRCFRAGETIRARPVGSVERGWRWCRRNRAVAALLAAVAAALLLGTAVATWYAFEADRQRQDAVAKQEEANTQLKRARSALKAAQLLRVESVGATAPETAFLLLHDETVWPTAERDFAWGVYHRWCRRTDKQAPLERATLTGHKTAADIAIVHSAAWAWAGPHLTVGDLTLAVWVARPRIPVGVECVCFSPDGKTLASASTDGTLKLWDAGSGEELATHRGHTGIVHWVCFSPDGKTLASAGWDKTIRLWDVQTRQEQTVLTGHAKSVRCVSFSPDGKTLASASREEPIKLWDVVTRREQATFEFHKNGAQFICFSPDGKTLASAREYDLHYSGAVQLWDVGTGKKCGPPMLHYKVWSVAFSPDGQTIVSASVDGRIKVWNTVTGEEQAYLRGHTSSAFAQKSATGVDFVGIHAVCFSPDGKTLASATDQEGINLWDAQTWQVRAALKGHRAFVNAVCFSPDGTTLASASDDGTVKLWQSQPGQERSTFSGHADEVHCVCFSPDGRTLASASLDKTVKLWDADSGHTRTTFGGHKEGVLAVSFSPDGKVLASGSLDNTMELWDVQTGEQLTSLTGFEGDTNYVESVCFSPDGHTLGSCCRGGRIGLWDLSTRTLHATLDGHRDGTYFACFSPNGKLLASASLDKTVKLWNVRTRQPLTTFLGHTNHVNSVCFSPDGKTLASASSDRTVMLWDVQSGELRATLKGHTDEVTAVCFSPDGKTLASGSYDRTVILWDTSTRQPCVTYRGHTDKVRSVCFAPDGKTLASGSSDRTNKLWDVPSLPPD